MNPLPTPADLPGWALLLAIVAAAVVGALLARWFARRLDGWRRRTRSQVGLAAERDAERVLRRAGYRVVERQLTGTWTLWVDGSPRPVTCRADLVVERGHERLVAEVKSAGPALDPTSPATRRQLLEYTMAFDVDGVILVDMRKRRLYRVEFPN